jgi:hypothetical protein
MLASSAVDSGFEPISSPTKDYKIDNSAIFHLYNGENKLIFNEMMMSSRPSLLVGFL